MKIEYLGVIATLMTICSFLIGRLGAFKKNTADEVSCKFNQQRDIKDLQEAIKNIEKTIEKSFNQISREFAKEFEVQQLKERVTKLENKSTPP